MKQEELFLSIEQCKHLQELGLDMSDAALCYLYFIDDNGNKYARPYFCSDLCDSDKFIYTYTLQEIMNRLPKKIEIEGWDYLAEINIEYFHDFNDWQIWYEHYKIGCIDEFYAHGTELIDAAFKMLYYVVENGWLDDLIKL